MTSDQFLARLVYLTAPEGEDEATFYHRKFSEQLKTNRDLREQLNLFADLLEAAYAVIRRHRKFIGLEAELEDAEDEVATMLRKLEAAS
jgi:hypothetical protein